MHAHGGFHRKNTGRSGLAPIAVASDRKGTAFDTSGSVDLAIDFVGFTRGISDAFLKQPGDGGEFGFRFHDLRHCAISPLAEFGASGSAMMAIAGHTSRRMLERYSNVRNPQGCHATVL